MKRLASKLQLYNKVIQKRSQHEWKSVGEIIFENHFYRTILQGYLPKTERKKELIVTAK